MVSQLQTNVEVADTLTVSVRGRRNGYNSVLTGLRSFGDINQRIHVIYALVEGVYAIVTIYTYTERVG